MIEYNKQWLVSRGFFQKEIPFDIAGKRVTVDDRYSLAYVEISNTEELEKIKDELSQTKSKYYWFFFGQQNKIRVFRKHGDIKWFYFSDTLANEFRESRIYKLNRFSCDNISVLFDVKDIATKFYDDLWETRRKIAMTCTQIDSYPNKLMAVQQFIDRIVFFYFLAQLKLVQINTGTTEYELDRKHTREFFNWICSFLTDEEFKIF